MNESGVVKVSPRSSPRDYIGQVVAIPTSRVSTLPHQPRVFFDAGELASLRESIAAIDQQQPATVVPWRDGTFRLRDGERRWRCCCDLKKPLIALVVDAKGEEEEFELATAANLNRASHSPLEKALAAKRLRDGPLKRSVSHIARTFGVSDTAVYNFLLVVDALPQRILDLMDPTKRGSRKKTLALSVALKLTALSKYPKQQLALAERIAEDSIPLQKATQMIEAFADAKEITTGHGRERSPRDCFRSLRRSLQNVSSAYRFFNGKTDSQIREMFAFTSPEATDEIMRDLDDTLATLTRLRESFDKADVGQRLREAR
jgi:ParB family chromosome partitioning protein